MNRSFWIIVCYAVYVYDKIMNLRVEKSTIGIPSKFSSDFYTFSHNTQIFKKLLCEQLAT